MNLNFGLGQQIEEVCGQVAKATEEYMLEQLNELVSRDLIRWEAGPVQIAQEIHPGGKLRVVCTGKFVLRAEEYIKELELQNAQLRAAMNIGIPRKKGG